MTSKRARKNNIHDGKQQKLKLTSKLQPVLQGDGSHKHTCRNHTMLPVDTHDSVPKGANALRKLNHGCRQSHPHGVQPLGNMYTGQHPCIRSAGLGHLAHLTDELLLNVLACATAPTLGRLCCVSRALYCFAMHEDLWRQQTLQRYEGDWAFRGSWRATFLSRSCPRQLTGGQPRHKALVDRAQHGSVTLQVRGMYSDLLFQPWRCARAPLLPGWLETESIPRRRGLTLQQFRTEFELTNTPVILTDVVTQWPAVSRWTREYLQQAFEGQTVVVGGYDMTYDHYLQYCERCADDEMPLYLFDKGFAAKAPHLAQDYSVPEHFADDLFALLGEDGRPDYRWLIEGPARSGSSFHKDPNSTSAWNGVVRGAKKWIMFPPHVQPAGVHASADGADVATPVSLIEWFLDFYADAKEQQPQECILREGELLFVPRGWWHLALNVEPSLAVTQNFVSPVTLPHASAFLSTRSEQLVSGCEEGDRAGLYDRLMAALKEHRPELHSSVVAQQRQRDQQVEQGSRLRQLFGQHHAGRKSNAKHALNDILQTADTTKAAKMRRIAGDDQPLVGPTAQASSFQFSFQV